MSSDSGPVPVLTKKSFFSPLTVEVSLNVDANEEPPWEAILVTSGSRPSASKMAGSTWEAMVVMLRKVNEGLMLADVHLRLAITCIYLILSL